MSRPGTVGAMGLSFAQYRRLQFMSTIDCSTSADATARVLLRLGLLEETKRLYFGPRIYAIKISEAGRKYLAAQASRP